MKEDPIEHLDDEIHDHIERETEDNIARRSVPPASLLHGVGR